MSPVESQPSGASKLPALRRGLVVALHDQRTSDLQFAVRGDARFDTRDGQADGPNVIRAGHVRGDDWGSFGQAIALIEREPQPR